MATADDGGEYGFPTTINPAETASIPLRKTLVLVNNFIVSTTTFLNHFSQRCERKLQKVSSELHSLESVISILEAKLNSPSGFSSTISGFSPALTTFVMPSSATKKTCDFVAISEAL